MKPAIKQLYKPVIEYNNMLIIGLDNESLEIEDEEGVFNKLLTLMDGTRTLHELSKEVEADVQELNEFIHELDSYGLLEDMEEVERAYLNEDGNKRYRANVNYFGNFSTIHTNKYAFQKSLRKSSVCVLGLGGSNMAVGSLVGMGISKLVGLDYDKVEISNLNRQFLYSGEDIGMQKTEAIKKRITNLNPEVEIEVHNLKVENSECLSAVIKDVDVVLNTIDQPSILSNRWVNFACVKHNKPFLQGGVANKRILWQKFLPNTSACYDCFLIRQMQSDPSYEAHLRGNYGLILEGRNTAFAPNIAVMTGFLTNEIVKHITNFAPAIQTSTSIMLDTIDYREISRDECDKIDCCPTCSENNISTEPVDLDTLIEIAHVNKGAEHVY